MNSFPLDIREIMWGMILPWESIKFIYQIEWDFSIQSPDSIPFENEVLRGVCHSSYSEHDSFHLENSSFQNDFLNAWKTSKEFPSIKHLFID